jgi:hypothetical protein
MTRTIDGKEERMFSIELRSRECVKNLSLDGREKALIEGSIGSLISARFLDGLVLEVVGSDGELRLDLGADELRLLPNGAERANRRGSGK